MQIQMYGCKYATPDKSINEYRIIWKKIKSCSGKLENPDRLWVGLFIATCLTREKSYGDKNFHTRASLKKCTWVN